MTEARLRRLRPVVLLVAMALGLRLGYVLLYPQLPLQADASDYDQIARSIVAGTGFRNTLGEPDAQRSPLYPLFVAGVYRLGSPDPFRVRVAQAVLGALLPVLILVIGRSCFAPRIAWTAAAASAGYPALIAYTGLVLTETVATLLVTGVTLCAVWAVQERDLRLFALLGVVLGLSALCRAEWAVLAGAMSLAALIPPADSWRKRFARAGMVCTTFLLILSPWMLRNYRALGGFVPLTTEGWPTLWIASYPERWLEWKAAEPLLSIEAGASSPLERSQHFRAAALDNLRSHPGAYVVMALQRVPLLLIGGHSNVISGLEGTTAESTGLRRILKIGLLALNTLVLAAAGAGLWRNRGRWSTLLPLYLTLLVPPIIYFLLFAVPRYHIPLLPIAFLFAADELLRLSTTRARPSRPRKDAYSDAQPLVRRSPA